jgi:hypothetical protein
LALFSGTLHVTNKKKIRNSFKSYVSKWLQQLFILFLLSQVRIVAWILLDWISILISNHNQHQQRTWSIFRKVSLLRWHLFFLLFCSLWLILLNFILFYFIYAMNLISIHN